MPSMELARSRSASQTVIDSKDGVSKPQISGLRRNILLLFFSLAQFLDVSNISTLVAAFPRMITDLDIARGDSVWLLSAYQLCFAAFLLLSGRMSDIYNPKHLFNIGFGGLGVISLIAGFMDNRFAIFVLRALVGIMAALTIPSALRLIVHLFPDPLEQGAAVALFGGSGGLGNVFGLLIGAIFVQLVNWHWIFFFNAIVAIPIAIICVVLIPANPAGESDETGAASKPAQGLDVIGVSILTTAIILFIFAVTSGSSKGWGTARVLAPLIISILMVVVFFIYEARIPEHMAALPPKIWYYPNFAVLFGVSMFPYLWWTAVFLLLTSFWQDVFLWNPLITATHFLPLGICAFAMIGLFTFLQKKFSIRTIILSAGALLVPGTILLTFADRASRYWSIAFPAFLLGTSGNALLFASANVAILQTAPASQSGIIGAVFNSALQLGAAVGASVITSIQSNVDAKQSNPLTTFKGRSAGYWFLFAILVVEIVCFSVFYRRKRSDPEELENPKEKEKESEPIDSKISTAGASVA